MKNSPSAIQSFSPFRELRHAIASRANTELRARASLERRALTDAEKAAGYVGALTGVIPYNSDSEVLTTRGRAKPFVERIAPDAFKRSLKEDKDIMVNAGHTDDPLAALARIGENLTITTDERGLKYEALLPDTKAARDLLQLVEKRIITGTSFEFEVRGESGQKWEKRDDRTDLRTILDARLVALNPVTWPAYSDTSLTVELRRHERAAREDETDRRGTYYKPEAGGVCDWYDPTVTADTKFAGNALHRATYALTDALEYLRAVAASGGSGALADYAKAEVAAAAANAATLLAWLAANGAEVNSAAVKRAQEKIAEARTAVPPPAEARSVAPSASEGKTAAAPASTAATATNSPDADRERRFRAIQLSSQ